MTDKDLSKGANHLAYEVWMLVKLADYLPGPTHSSPTIERMLHNSLIEAFVMHARVLLDFLEPHSRPRPDDIRASQFFSDTEEWPRLFQNNVEWETLKAEVDRICTRVDKEVAHLTQKRIDVGCEKDWNARAVLTSIVPRLRMFTQKADRLPSETKAFIFQLVSIVPSSLGVFSTSMPTSAATGFRALF